MAKKSFTADITWHFFLPAIGGFLITWIFSESAMLSFQVGLVVLIFTFIGAWLKDK